jgi:transcriptional regulator
LDEYQVRVIKSLKGELSQVDIADYFKVSRANIHAIVAGKTWKHLQP